MRTCDHGLFETYKIHPNEMKAYICMHHSTVSSRVSPRNKTCIYWKVNFFFFQIRKLEDFLISSGGCHIIWTSSSNARRKHFDMDDFQHLCRWVGVAIDQKYPILPPKPSVQKYLLNWQVKLKSRLLAFICQGYIKLTTFHFQSRFSQVNLIHLIGMS